MKFIRATTIVAGLLALMGASLAQQGRDGTVNLPYWQAVSILNPHLSGGTKDIFGSSIVPEPLARYAPDGSFVPYLASEIPTQESGGISDDLRSITWTLRDDVVWPDGRHLPHSS